MGRNGLGKTTLLKSLLVGDKEIDKEMRSELHDADFTNDSGTVKWGHEAQIGYFPQDVSNVIENGLTVADWLHQFDPEGDQGRYSRHSGADAFPRRRRSEEDRCALGR